MFYLSLVLLLLTLPITFAQTYAEPHEDVATGDTSHCRNPIIRKEWYGATTVPQRLLNRC